MPLVRVRVRHGTKVLADPTGPFASECTVAFIVEEALEIGECAARVRLARERAAEAEGAEHDGEQQMANEADGEPELAAREERWATLAPLSLESIDEWREWVVLSADELDWDAPLRQWHWVNRRVAHKWDTGWDFATYKGERADRDGGGYWLYYKSVRQTYPHVLSCEQYGVDKVWVVIAKVGT